jgi:hypothetical protein
MTFEIDSLQTDVAQESFIIDTGDVGGNRNAGQFAMPERPDPNIGNAGRKRVYSF